MPHYSNYLLVFTAVLGFAGYKMESRTLSGNEAEVEKNGILITELKENIICLTGPRGTGESNFGVALCSSVKKMTLLDKACGFLMRLQGDGGR